MLQGDWGASCGSAAREIGLKPREKLSRVAGKVASDIGAPLVL